MWRALPASTTSVSAPIVSCSGTRVVVAVALVEVDVVGLQPLQRAVDLLEDLLAREPAVARPHREVDLRRQHVRVARVVAAGSRPTRVSAAPVPYTLAVSKSVIPASNAARVHASVCSRPIPPEYVSHDPSATVETSTPESPSSRFSIAGD